MAKTLRTPEKIVDQTNQLACEFYRLQGYVAKAGYKFHQATHPQEVLCWRMACAAQEALTQTDPRNALDELAG